MTDAMKEMLKKGAREVIFAAFAAFVAFLQMEVAPHLPPEYTTGIWGVVWLLVGMLDKWIHENDSIKANGLLPF